jgi:hypothetical protein
VPLIEYAATAGAPTEKIPPVSNSTGAALTTQTIINRENSANRIRASNPIHTFSHKVFGRSRIENQTDATSN